MNSMEKQLETINVCTKVATKTEQTSRQDLTKSQSNKEIKSAATVSTEQTPTFAPILFLAKPRLASELHCPSTE